MSIFQPFRALGLVSDGRAWAIQRRGSETFVTLTVGHAWQIFNCAKLQLIIVGPQLQHRILSLATVRDYTYAATGRKIAVFKRAHLVAEWDAHQSKILHLLAFGNQILSVDKQGQVFIWPISQEQADDVKQPSGGFQLRAGFTPTCIVHPDTYLNKVLIGSEEGPLQLWNISTEKLIHEFKGWGSPICSCVSSPALDVVAIGCADGRLHLHNLKYDETVVTFTHTTRGPVTAISFRTDGQPLVAAGGNAGVITIWNLDKRKLHTVIKDAHDGEISGLHFLASEPVLLSVAKDNSMKMWVFDTSDGEARLLRFRSGHSAPPTCVSYYGSGRLILSAGQDRAFRVFSTIQDQQSRELSQGHVAKRAKRMSVKEEELKLPPVLAFAAAEIRERDWCNVVTCHADGSSAYSWRLQNFVIGEHVLTPSENLPTPVKACAISACGNFAVLGTESGWIERFNLQSGLTRGSYLDAGSNPHVGAVVGLACDATNTHLISGGYDAVIKVWDFRGLTLQSSLNVGSPIVKLVHHRGNGLVAAASNDMVVRVYDVVAVRLVRRFVGHTDRITDLCFSEDGKWLVSSSMDGTVRTWDVVGSKQLDAMQVDAAVTALSLSPSMDILATAHVNKNAIYLWANRLLYSGVVDMEQGSGGAVVSVSLPTISSGGGDVTTDDTKLLAATSVSAAEVEPESRAVLPHTATTQIVPELVTMAILPRTQWLGLVNLDVIKERNKPIAPPKKPEKAPFFLPTLPSVSGVPHFAPENQAKDADGNSTEGKEKRSLSKFNKGGLQSQFLHLLAGYAENGNHEELLAYMKTMPPSTVDFELRMLQSVGPGVADQQGQSLEVVLDFFIKQLASNNNFELLQAWIQLFLKVHGESINKEATLREKAQELSKLQRAVWTRLDGIFQHVRCMVGFISQVNQ